MRHLGLSTITLGLGLLLSLGARKVSAQDAVEKNFRLVFRAKTAAELKKLQDQIPEKFKKSLVKTVLGLNEEKIRKLKELSGGKVDFSGIYSLDLPKGQAKALEKISALSSIIEPDVKPPVFVTDPSLTGEYWIDGINVRPAWDAGYSGRGVTIADCDAGYYTDEPDIRANLLLEHGYDLADRHAPLVINDGPYATHGTSVAAIMNGVHDESGTNGIAYEAKLVPLQNYNYDPGKDDLGKEEATAQCILRAVQIPEVKILILENQTARGSSETYAGTREAVRLAIQAGLIVISAGGNASAPLTAEENDDTGSIIVGALSRTGSQADFSNFGPRISISAYGEDLFTLEGPNGAFGNFGGTSGATPQVGGAAALMLQANPSITHQDVKEIFEQTRIESSLTRDIGGKLDIMAAVSAALNRSPRVEFTNAQRDFRSRAIAILRE